MSHHPYEPSRRRFAQLLGLSAALAAAPLVTGAPPAAADSGRPARGAQPGHPDPPDAVAGTYYRVLLAHTRWSETQWDAQSGHYTATDFGFAVVLGNAVLLTRGHYDADAAGTDRETLRTRTLATIRHFAASNRLTGGTEWGRTLFFDTTFQSYFILAARLLWTSLDAETRRNVDTIARAQARYTTALGTGDDPGSGSWTPHGASGGFQGDTKLEEMGVYAQSLAPGIAWAPGDPQRDDWRAAFGRWSRNEAGLPAADLANPARVDGVPVGDNTAQNLYDTFIVENHGSFGPHYQAELWRTSGRNAAHFITAGQPLPEVLTAQPNAGPLWETLLMVMSDAGEPLMPMVEDREHLYGRDVIPLAFLAQVAGDRAAARAEAALAGRLLAYQAYPPQYRMAKFSGEPKYEPEARAEIAISYLLHEWRARTGAPVRPLHRHRSRRPKCPGDPALRTPVRGQGRGSHPVPAHRCRAGPDHLPDRSAPAGHVGPGGRGRRGTPHVVDAGARRPDGGRPRFRAAGERGAGRVDRWPDTGRARGAERRRYRLPAGG